MYAYIDGDIKAMASNMQCHDDHALMPDVISFARWSERVIIFK